MQTTALFRLISSRLQRDEVAIVTTAGCVALYCIVLYCIVLYYIELSLFNRSLPGLYLRVN